MLLPGGEKSGRFRRIKINLRLFCSSASTIGTSHGRHHPPTGNICPYVTHRLLRLNPLASWGRGFRWLRSHQQHVSQVIDHLIHHALGIFRGSQSLTCSMATIIRRPKRVPRLLCPSPSRPRPTPNTTTGPCHLGSNLALRPRPVCGDLCSLHCAPGCHVPCACRVRRNTLHRHVLLRPNPINACWAGCRTGRGFFMKRLPAAILRANKVAHVLKQQPPNQRSDQPCQQGCASLGTRELPPTLHISNPL